MKTSTILSVASLSSLLVTSLVAAAGVFSPVVPTEVVLGAATAFGTALLLVSEYSGSRRLTTTPTRARVTLLPATEAFASARIAVVPNAGIPVVQYL
jgi:hypothetical protein